MTTPYIAGFTTQPEERQIAALPVQGTIPAWLTGTLIRNGPAQFESGTEGYRHWFDGSAMLHAFTFEGGQVAYRNRFLRTPQYASDADGQGIRFRGFATDPCRSLFARFMAIFNEADGLNANVNVTRIEDDYIAMTETPMPVRFDPRTLDTLGVYDYAGDALVGQVTTAHPHFDFERGIGINYLLKFGAQAMYQLYALHGKQRRLITRLPAAQAAYMHSFAITERYIVLVEYPLRLPSPLSILLSGRPFIENYVWQPSQPTVFTVIEKDGGAVVARAEGDPFFSFHHINAYEDGDAVIVDLSAYADSSLIDHLMLDRLRTAAGIPQGEYRRCRVPLAGGQVTHSRVTEASIELPRIHYRRVNGKPYQYAYGASIAHGTHDFLNQLVKVDVTTGAYRTWRQPGCYPSEPVFVPAPANGSPTAEDAGLVLTVVLDSAAGSSFLLVQDAATFDEIGRASVPGVVPFGFHGLFASG